MARVTESIKGGAIGFRVEGKSWLGYMSVGVQIALPGVSCADFDPVLAGSSDAPRIVNAFGNGARGEGTAVEGGGRVCV